MTEYNDLIMGNQELFSLFNGLPINRTVGDIHAKPYSLKGESHGTNPRPVQPKNQDRRENVLNADRKLF